MKNLRSKLRSFSKFEVLFYSVLIFVLFGLMNHFEIFSYFSLDSYNKNKHLLKQSYLQNPGLTQICFFLVYTAYIVLCVPGTWVFWLAAGGLFGFWLGTAIIAFGSTFGALIVFLICRYFFHDYIQRKFAENLNRTNSLIEKDGNMVLLSMRLIPVVPHMTVNLIMGLTNMKPKDFFIITLIGSFVSASVYTNAGRTLVDVKSVKDLMDSSILLGLAAVALLPVLIKWIWNSKKLNLKKKSSGEPTS